MGGTRGKYEKACVKVDKGVKHTKRSIILDLPYSIVCGKVSAFKGIQDNSKRFSWVVIFHSRELNKSLRGHGEIVLEKTVRETQDKHRIHLPATRLCHQEMWRWCWWKTPLSFSEARWLSPTSVSGQMTAYLVSSPIKHLSVHCASRPD